MRKLFFSILAVGVFFAQIGILRAVDAPTVEERQKAEAGHQKEINKKAKDQRASGCHYGRDKVTGKCYEPKEGQFYRDPKTGEVRVKKIKKINTPW